MEFVIQPIIIPTRAIISPFDYILGPHSGRVFDINATSHLIPELYFHGYNDQKSSLGPGPKRNSRLHRIKIDPLKMGTHLYVRGHLFGPLDRNKPSKTSR